MFSLGKKLVIKYLDELRARYGNIFFASSDWAVEWLCVIDSAIEKGKRAALDVRRDLLK